MKTVYKHPTSNIEMLYRDGQYALTWNWTDRTSEYVGWYSEDEIIRWAMHEHALPKLDDVAQFVLGYFPEGLVTLVALENA